MSVVARCVALSTFLILLACQIQSARADIIYDNSGPGDPTGVWYSVSPLQYGDEIILGTNITSHVLTQFQFEYFGDFTPSGDEMAEVRIYKNDGPPITVQGLKIPTPGTLLYDSHPFSISTNYETWSSTFLNVELPDDVTWTVQFTGLTGKSGDRAGILFRNPPTVGSSYSDGWLETTNGWQTVLFSKPANFAARLNSDLPKIAIRPNAETVVVEWSGTAILQVADNVEGPYQDLPQFRNKYTYSTHNSQMKFWRLRD